MESLNALAVEEAQILRAIVLQLFSHCYYACKGLSFQETNG